MHKLAILAMVLLSQPAMADDDISVSAGIRLWNLNYQGNGNAAGRTLAIGSRLVTNNDSGRELAPILVGSIRYKEFGLSASHFVKTSFLLTDTIQTSTVDRKESDIHASYFFLPGLSAGIGYKRVDLNDKLGTNPKIDGPIVSVSGAAALGSGFGLYGTLALGKLKADSSFNTSNVAYTLSDVGLVYSFDGMMKGLSLTLGYRFQELKVKGSPIFNGQEFRDTTTGPALGLIGRF